MRTLVIVLLSVACMANAAETITPQKDSRFTTVHDKDHPWGFSADFSTRDSWQQRADFVRHQAMAAQGLWPMPPKVPLNPVIHGKIDRDAYTIEKVFFVSMPGHYVTGNLYRPKNKPGKLPAVLCPYGHWPDGRFWWRDQAGIDKEINAGAETDPVAARSPLQANCAMLARMGCIVFQYDMVGYCDSDPKVGGKIPHREGFLDTEAVLRLQSFMGLQTWNSIRSLDFVLSLPDVDPSRIAVTGSSSGGTQTMALDACDPRATVAFPMVMVSMNMQGGCVCENAPLYRVQTNDVELATLFAPRPEGMAAANDWTIDFLKRGLPEMKKIWGLFGAEDEVEGEHFDFPHNHNLHSREAQYSFLNKQLRLGWPEPVKEHPFEPVPPKDLSVYDADHPRPADEADAKTLRATMTKTSDAQLAAMPDDEYRQTVRTALEAMVVDQMPSPKDVQVTGDERFPNSGGVWTGSIGRKNAGECVPCKIVVPRQWRGGFVIWADPDGCASISADDPDTQKIRDAGFAIIAIDWFDSGSFKPATRPTSPAKKRGDPNPPYAGYTLGYERSVLANRVHDLLTAIAWANSFPTSGPPRVIAFRECGPVALLACALAGEKVSRAAIDLNQFDFDKITRDTDPMLLPGALKYGGIWGFVPLCDSGSVLLCNAPAKKSVRKCDHVTIDAQPRETSAMVEWLVEKK